MKTYNVIAIGGSGVQKLVGNLVDMKEPAYGEKSFFRGYMAPGASTIEVNEETKEVLYNGEIYEFVEYRKGIHGSAKVVTFMVRGILIEAYTDSPSSSGISSEKILAALKRRKEDPHSGY